MASLSDLLKETVNFNNPEYNVVLSSLKMPLFNQISTITFPYAKSMATTYICRFYSWQRAIAWKQC